MGGLRDEKMDLHNEPIATAQSHDRGVDGNADGADAGVAGARRHHDCAMDI
jgi:hypothetical protein